MSPLPDMNRKAVEVEEQALTREGDVASHDTIASNRVKAAEAAARTDQRKLTLEAEREKFDRLQKRMEAVSRAGHRRLAASLLKARRRAEERLWNIQAFAEAAEAVDHINVATGHYEDLVRKRADGIEIPNSQIEFAVRSVQSACTARDEVLARIDAQRATHARLAPTSHQYRVAWRRRGARAVKAISRKIRLQTLLDAAKRKAERLEDERERARTEGDNHGVAVLTLELADQDAVIASLKVAFQQAVTIIDQLKGGMMRLEAEVLQTVANTRCAPPTSCANDEPNFL